MYVVNYIAIFYKFTHTVCIYVPIKVIQADNTLFKTNTYL